MRQLLAVALSALVVASAGCGGDKRATVSGNVTLGGKGLPGGTITFVSVADDKRVASAGISADGSYKISDAPVGECKVLVDNSHLDPASLKDKAGTEAPGGAGAVPGMKGGPAASGKAVSKDVKAKMGAAPKDVDLGGMGQGASGDQKYVKIDKSFGGASTTSLKATVVAGDNTHNFEVK